MKSVPVKVAAVVVGVCVLGLCALAGGAPALSQNDPSQTASATIPADLLTLLETAAATSSCDVPWTLLAAVANTESRFNPTAVSSSGAEGIFQFEPGTFAEYADPVPTGGAAPPSPFDPTDATYAAARYLCALGVTSDPTSALVAYNCGNPSPACQAASIAYAEQVLATAASYTAASSGVGNAVQTEAVAYAESQIGTPYEFGGASPQTGFDCQGLVVWAYGLAGVSVPTGANNQWQSEPHVALAQLVPGDLVFFGTGPLTSHSVAEHVGIYVGNDAMVDAPHTGADVRVEPFTDVVGAAWGADVLLGAVDPVAT